MTKKEALQILAILKAAYPSSYHNMTKEEAQGTVAVWCMQFAEMPVDIVLMAVHKLIATNKFPPSVAEVKDKISTIHWEAHNALSDGERYGNLSEKAKVQYQRIFELTDSCRVGIGYEPKITQLVSNQLLLGGE